MKIFNARKDNIWACTTTKRVDIHMKSGSTGFDKIVNQNSCNYP